MNLRKDVSGIDQKMIRDTISDPRKSYSPLIERRKERHRTSSYWNLKDCGFWYSVDRKTHAGKQSASAHPRSDERARDTNR